MAAISRPWKLILGQPGADPVERQYRSEAALYRAAAEERAAIAAGRSRVTAMAAYQWEADYNRWALWERLPITEPS